jgi:hypothetical protein
MTYLRDLQAEILSGPRAADCAQYVNDGTDPARKHTAREDDVAIAAILSEGRTKVVPKLIGDSDVAVALGIPAGPLFLYRLESLATTPPSSEATEQQVVAHAVARQAWRSLEKDIFNIGDSSVRAAIDAFVGTLLTADEALTVKAIAELPAPVTAAEVSNAMRGPWGDE